MYSVEVSHIAKAFGSNQAVKDVSFQVRPGEIFGKRYFRVKRRDGDIVFVAASEVVAIRMPGGPGVTE